MENYAASWQHSWLRLWLRLQVFALLLHLIYTKRVWHIQRVIILITTFVACMSIHFSLKYIDSGQYDGLVFCPTLNPCPLSFAVWSMKDRRDDCSSSLQNFQNWCIFAVNFIQFKLPIQGTKSPRVQLNEKSERKIAQKIQQESFEVRYVTCCLLSPVLLTWNFHPQTSEVLFSCLPLSMYRNRWGNMVYLFKLNYGVKLWLRFFFFFFYGYMGRCCLDRNVDLFFFKPATSIRLRF